MYQYLYVSSAVELFSESQLQELLEVSRARNLSSGVTGVLLYVRGNFIQLLEGEQADVEATRARIAADPRHRGLITLLEGDCDRRDFPDWSMGFPCLNEAQAAQLPGYSDFLTTSAGRDASQSGARKLLDFFRELNG
jgi:hypothetical protein